MNRATQAKHLREIGSSGFSVRHDDYSAQVSAMDDALFWVRAERSNSETVTISDLKRSRADAVRIAAALDIAVGEAAPHAAPAALHVLDLVPSDRDPVSSARKAGLEAARLAEAFVIFAKGRGLTVRSVERRTRGDKQDINVAFAPEG
jgi:hypothetical protein